MIVDDFLKNRNTTKSVTVWINGKPSTAYKIAKPMGSEPFLSRVKDAWRVLRNRGTVVQYFDDLSKTEQVTYVLKQLREENLR